MNDAPPAANQKMEIRAVLPLANASLRTLLETIFDKAADREIGAPYKIMMETMVEDCVRVWRLPEYPSAAHALWLTVRFLHDKLKLPTVDEVTKSFAVQVIGSVCANVYAPSLATSADDKDVATMIPKEILDSVARTVATE